VPAPDGVHVQGTGSLLVLDKAGKQIASLSDAKLLDGPWDLTVQDFGTHANVYVSNVLNGTISRIALSLNPKADSVKVVSKTQIAGGFAFRTDPAALVVGPTGLAYNWATDTLYVASTGDNAIFAIAKASARKTTATTGKLVYKDATHLRGPLALLFAGKNLIASNGDAVNPDASGQANSELIEFTPAGQFLNSFQVDTPIGAAFGIAHGKHLGHQVFAAVDDATNTLLEWTI
jgi:DNA-binding beta-propeller fold protein YncE